MILTKLICNLRFILLNRLDILLLVAFVLPFGAFRDSHQPVQEDSRKNVENKVHPHDAEVPPFMMRIT